MRRSTLQRLSITACLMIVCVWGCRKNTPLEASQPSHDQSPAGFSLNYKEKESPQVLTSELFLSYISIFHHHMEQNQPTLYYANHISKIVLHNTLFPGTNEWFLDRVDIYLNDGTVKTEYCIKNWYVKLEISSGHDSKPVLIEQHFSQKVL